MITIREKQLDVFRRIPFTNFETRLVRHFFRFYPRECRLLGEARVRRVIQDGVERATFHGYETQREVGYYISLMFLLGSDFDRDPQLPWVAAQIDDASVGDPLTRIKGLFEMAGQYLAETVGPENQHLVRALLRIRAYDFEETTKASPETFPECFHRLLEYFFPQKCTFQGEAATRALIDLGLESAEQYEITGNKGKAIYATLMFMLGSGVAQDLIHPWVGAILNDQSLGDEEARVNKLYQESIAYIGQALAER